MRALWGLLYRVWGFANLFVVDSAGKVLSLYCSIAQEFIEHNSSHSLYSDSFYGSMVRGIMRHDVFSF